MGNQHSSEIFVPTPQHENVSSTLKDAYTNDPRTSWFKSDINVTFKNQFIQVQVTRLPEDPIYVYSDKCHCFVTVTCEVLDCLNFVQSESVCNEEENVYIPLALENSISFFIYVGHKPPISSLK